MKEGKKLVMRTLPLASVLLSLGIPDAAQTPTIFDVSDVVVGTQRTPTRYFFAQGKWSDAGTHESASSTEIHCYKALEFCEVASAILFAGEATVQLNSFDILRWDEAEMIAVDSTPICMVNTLRADFRAKRVTLSSSDKGVTKDPFCKGTDKLGTAVLWGVDDVIKDQIERTSPKK
jgi:hypothetical protein